MMEMTSAVGDGFVAAYEYGTAGFSLTAASTLAGRSGIHWHVLMVAQFDNTSPADLMVTTTGACVLVDDFDSACGKVHSTPVCSNGARLP